MRNTFLAIAAVIVLLVGVGAYFVLNKQAPVRPIPTDTTIMDKSESQGDLLTQDNSTTSAYVPYSKAALDGAASNKRVLFFYANWCPTCKPADESFSSNVDKIPQNVSLIRVNYNDSDTDQEEKELAKKYGVTYQHTFVQIDENGNEIGKWNGGKIDELLSNVR